MISWKEMVGKQVDAELYKLPDGQLRASHVRAMRPVIENIGDDEMPALEGQEEEWCFSPKVGNGLTILRFDVV